MKTVRDLLDVLKKLPPDSEIADNHLGDIYIEVKKTKWRKIFSFKEEKKCLLGKIT